MLHVYFGSDVIKTRQTAFAFLHTLEASGVTVDVIDGDNYQPDIYADAAGGASLFGQGSVYLVDTPSSQKDWYEETIRDLELLAESANVFVVIEGALLAPEKKKFAKYAVKIEEFKAGPTERFNTFALADALTRKDKKSLWLLFHEAILSGIAVEEIVGVLWWQLKALRLAALTKSAQEADMKDFPYNKAKRALSKFKDGELEHLSQSLLALQHKSRLGLHDLDIVLEKWLLKI